MMKRLEKKIRMRKGIFLRAVMVLLALILVYSCRDGGTLSNSTSSQQSVTWYVDPSAPPGGDGLSPETAFNSITMAIYPNNLAWERGDDILLLPGSYTKAEVIDLNPVGKYAGYAGNPMVIKADPGAVFSAPLVITGVVNLVLENISIQAVQGEALVVRDSKNLRIVNCYVQGVSEINTNPDPTLNVPGNAIHIIGSSGITLENCSIQGVDSYGIIVENSSDVKLYGNSVYNAGNSGLLIESASRVDLKEDSFAFSWIGVEIRGKSDHVNVYKTSVISNIFAGFLTSFDAYFTPESPLRLERVLAAGNSVGLYFSKDKGTFITNATVSDNSQAGVILHFTDGVTLKNSIVTFNEDGIADYASSSSNMYVDYVDLYGNTGYDLVNVPVGTHVLHADPLFEGPSSFEYYALQESSPCIDAGDPADTPPPGGEPTVDLGAIEYIKDANNPPM